MLRDITLGHYVDGQSALHRLHPSVKIAITFGYVVLLFLADGRWTYLVLTGFLIIAVEISGISWKLVLRSLRPILFFAGFTLVFHFVLTPGETLAFLGPLEITAEGVRRGLTVAGRLALIVMAGGLLTLTTSPLKITDGLENLLRPARRIGLPAHELAMMSSIALRFFPTLAEETERIMKAQMARGASFEDGKLTRRAQALLALVIPLLVSVLRRAAELAVAMEARCYRGGAGRSKMVELKVNKVDYVAMVSFILLAAITIWLG